MRVSGAMEQAPDIGAMRPAMPLSSVDLPDPFGPTMAVSAPRASSPER